MLTITLSFSTLILISIITIGTFIASVAIAAIVLVLLKNKRSYEIPDCEYAVWTQTQV